MIAGLLLLLFGSASFGSNTKLPFAITVVWECRLDFATNAEALQKFRATNIKMIHLVSPICVIKDEQFGAKLNLQAGDALGVYLSAHVAIVQAAGVTTIRERPTFWGNDTVSETQGDDVWLGAYAADEIEKIVEASANFVAKIGKVEYVATAGGLVSPALAAATSKHGFAADLSQFAAGVVGPGTTISLYPLGKWLRGEESPDTGAAETVGAYAETNRTVVLTNLPPLDWASSEQVLATAQALLFSHSNTVPLMFRFHVESAQKYAEAAILTVQRLQDLAKSANLVLEPVTEFESQAFAAH